MPHSFIRYANFIDTPLDKSNIGKVSTIEQAPSRQIIHDFISSLILRPFSADEKLVSDRVLDSVNLVELTLFLEQHFSVKISPHEMNSLHFDSIEKIIALIQKKKLAAGGAI